MTDRAVRRNVDAVFGLAAPPPPPPLSLGEARVSANVRASDFSARLPVTRERPFSVFDDADAERASKLAGALSTVARDGDPAGALERAAALAAEVASTEPGLARHALGLFSTHDPLGRPVPLPTLLRRTAATALADTAALEVALGDHATGDEARLDWFRGDPLANEHHEHWHLVYPRNPPPGRPLKERHGELFYYMHAQMLARYDVERIAAGLPRVEPLTDFDGSLGEGYEPGLLRVGFDLAGRAAGATMVDNGQVTRALLRRCDDALAEAARARTLGTGPDAVPLDGHAGSDLLGNEAENAPPAQLFPAVYRNHHGFGHGLIAAASDEGRGVIADPATAIRDPAFWRWHRRVDDIHFAYQDALDPHDFADRPPASIEGLAAEAEGAAGGAAPGRLATRLREGVYRLLGGGRFRYRYLSHDPFQVRVTVRNDTSAPVPVTVRLFLVPEALFDPAADPATPALRQGRRFAIELDKVKFDAPPGIGELVRAGRDMSVIRRPAVVDPAEVADIEGGDEDESAQECTCGWPFGLLLPRGMRDAGMPFRLFAMLTDNVADRIGSPKRCGSMSFCGTADGYPDARPMGYPFDRRLPMSLEALVAANPNMAMVPVSIIHDGDA